MSNKAASSSSGSSSCCSSSSSSSFSSSSSSSSSRRSSSRSSSSSGNSWSCSSSSSSSSENMLLLHKNMQHNLTSFHCRFGWTNLKRIHAAFPSCVLENSSGSSSCLLEKTLQIVYCISFYFPRFEPPKANSCGFLCVREEIFELEFT